MASTRGRDRGGGSEGEREGEREREREREGERERENSLFTRVIDKHVCERERRERRVGWGHGWERHGYRLNVIKPFACELAACVLKWCKRVLNAWLVLRPTYAVDVQADRKK